MGRHMFSLKHEEIMMSKPTALKAVSNGEMAQNATRK